MEQYSKQHNDCYFWFDAFSSSLSEGSRQTSEWWRAMYAELVSRVGRVLVVVSPWSNPIQIRRAWCLWEMFIAITISKNVLLEVSLPKAEKQLPRFLTTAQVDNLVTAPAAAQKNKSDFKSSACRA
jgi:hypothetical protein